jgi:PAS domain S-box-containing protein
MFESHSAPMLLIEPESGSIEEANAAAADFYGYSVEELRDMTIQQINCLSPAEVAAERSRARAQNRNHFEFEHRLASDEVRTVEVHSSPVEVDGRELLFSVIHDITERKRREREYEQIFDGVNDIIAIHDPETGEMVDVNRRMCELTGHDRETALELGVDGLLGEHPSQDYAPDEASTVIDRTSRYSRPGTGSSSGSRSIPPGRPSAARSGSSRSPET